MFKGRFTKDGKGFVFSDFYRAKLKTYMRSNPSQPFEIVPTLAESSKQRGWFEGGLCPLIAFYHEGLDHRDYKDVKKVREWLKTEFNSEIVGLFGKTHRIAKSTKNELNSGFLERVIDYLIENYSPPEEVLNPKKYKHWKDAVYPYDGPDTYIDYLLDINLLKNMAGEERNINGFASQKIKDLEEIDGSPNYSLTDEEE